LGKQGKASSRVNRGLSDSANYQNSIFAIYFSDPNHGWAVGWGGEIVKFDAFPTNRVKHQPNLEFTAFPNPGKSGLLNFEFNGPFNLKIFDQAGRLPFHRQKLKDQVSLPIFLKQGLYFARATNETSSLTLKLIVD
jgi:hypothetical protein